MRLKKVSITLAILTLVFFTLGFYPAQSAAKERYEEKFEKTVALAKDGKMSLRNISGDITVQSWGKEQVKINAFKISRASSLEKAKDNAGEVTIEVNKEDNTVRINTEYPKVSFKSLNVSVNYQLNIPSQASVKIKSVSGDVTLVEIGGAVEVNAVSGDIEVSKADKGVDCTAVSGDLKLKDITGNADLNTVSGDITLEGLKGSLDVETVSGDVEMIGVSGANVVKGKVLSGFIVYQGDINPDGKYSLKSHSGRIEMILPSGSTFDVEAKTFSGKIVSDFDITVSGKISKMQLQGTVGGGGASVTLKTFSGNIYLKKK